jgi:hypothetical protein
LDLNEIGRSFDRNSGDGRLFSENHFNLQALRIEWAKARRMIAPFLKKTGQVIFGLIVRDVYPSIIGVNGIAFGVPANEAFFYISKAGLNFSTNGKPGTKPGISFGFDR